MVEVSPSTVMQLNERATASRVSALQRRRRDRGVGEDEGQHRRHVRGDHPRAFGDAIDAHRPAFDLGRPRGTLGEGVGRGDGPRRGLPIAFAEVVVQARQSANEAINCGNLADDAGRRHEHLIGGTAENARGGDSGLLHGPVASRAGEGVGVAGVDDEAAGTTIAQTSAGTTEPARRPSASG